MSSTVWKLPTRTEPPVQLNWDMTVEEIGEKLELDRGRSGLGLKEFRIIGNFVLTDHYIQKIVKLFEGTDITKGDFNTLITALLTDRLSLTGVRMEREILDFCIITRVYYFGSTGNHIHNFHTNIKQYFN